MTFSTSTTSTALGSLQRVSKSSATLFNSLGIYRLCVAFIVIDFLDILDFLDFSDLLGNAIKYVFAAIVIGFMTVYFLRWKKIGTAIAPIIFLLLFVATGLVFAINFFIYGERQSYISAFISPLVFSLALFIPPNTIILDAGRIIRGLMLLFSVGSVFYLIEAIIKPLDIVQGLSPLAEVQVHKSLLCVLALCLCILTGRKALGLFFAVVIVVALALRPLSTLVLALVSCVPIAIALRSRVSYPRPLAVLMARAMAMTTLLVVISIPLLLYFYFDSIAPFIESTESYLKSDVIGGRSNMAFRLAILKYVFTAMENTSLWYGSALSGTHTVPLALMPGWEWWWHTNGSAEATIHSDFAVMLVLTGILGYIIFSIAFYLVLKNRFRELARRDLRGNGVVLQAISIIGVVALLIYCSDQPYLSYYNHTLPVWMLLLISEVARKAKVIGSADKNSKAIVPTLGGEFSRR